MSAEAKIKAKITGDGTGLDVALTKAKQGVEKFKNDNLKSMAGMIGGAFAVGAVVSWGKAVLDSAGALSDTSAAVGVTTDALQALTAAGAGAGLSQDDLVTKLGKLRDAQDNVVNGDEKMIATLKRFGITAEQAVRADTARLLELIATGAKDNATAFADLNDIFGKESAAKMNGMLTELADNGLQKTIDQYKALGMVIDATYIAKLDEAGDSLERFQKKGSNFSVKYGAMLLENIQDTYAIASEGVKEAYKGFTSGTFKGVMSAGTGYSFFKGMYDGYGKVKNNEIGSGKDKADAQKARDVAKVEQDKAKAAQLVQMQENQLAALEKELAKSQADWDKKTAKTADDVQKAKAGDSVKADPLNAMAAVGRYAGGRGGAGMYAVSTAERQGRIQEKIADIEAKSAEELKGLNGKMLELNAKIDKLNQTIGG